MQSSRWECSAALRFGFKGCTLASECRRREVSKIRYGQTEALLEPTCQKSSRVFIHPGEALESKGTSPPSMI